MFDNFFTILKVKVKRNKLLIQNFSFLSVLQIFNFILPLVTYPYLIRVLGKETYGLIIYVQSIVAFLVIIIGFGFNISATKEISFHRNDLNKLNQIVTNVFTIKAILFLLIAIIMSILFYFTKIAYGFETLLLLTLWMCIYEIIFPIWYFQGIEKMKYITYITLISRFTFLGLIFVFIKSPSDYLFVPIINGIGAILAGIVSLYIIFRKHKLKFLVPKFFELKYYLKESIPFFFSNILVVFRERSNVLIIGTLFTLGEVAYYDLAQKIIEIIRLPFTIIKDTIFPSIANERNRLKLHKFFKFSLFLALMVNIIILIFTPFLVEKLGGLEMLDSINLTRLFSFMIPLSVISMYMGTTIIIFGSNKIYRNSIIISSVSYVGALIILYLVQNINSYTVILASLFSLTAEIFYRNFKIKKIGYNESTF